MGCILASCHLHSKILTVQPWGYETNEVNPTSRPRTSPLPCEQVMGHGLEGTAYKESRTFEHEARFHMFKQIWSITEAATGMMMLNIISIIYVFLVTPCSLTQKVAGSNHPFNYKDILSLNSGKPQLTQVLPSCHLKKYDNIPKVFLQNFSKNVSVKDLFLRHCLHFVLSTKCPLSFIVEIKTLFRSNINKQLRFQK